MNCGSKFSKNLMNADADAWIRQLYQTSVFKFQRNGFLLPTAIGNHFFASQKLGMRSLKLK